MRRALPLCDYAGALLRELCVNKSAAANEANMSVLPRNLIRTSHHEASQVPRGLRVFGPQRRPLCGVNTEAAARRWFFGAKSTCILNITIFSLSLKKAVMSLFGETLTRWFFLLIFTSLPLEFHDCYYYFFSSAVPLQSGHERRASKLIGRSE